MTQKLPVILGVMALALVTAVLSLRLGVRPIGFVTIFEAFTTFDPTSADHLTVRQLRVPRAVAALIGGGSSN